MIVTDADGTVSEFPDDATPEEINAALGAPKPENFAQRALQERDATQPRDLIHEGARYVSGKLVSGLEYLGGPVPEQEKESLTEALAIAGEVAIGFALPGPKAIPGARSIPTARAVPDIGTSFVEGTAGAEVAPAIAKPVRAMPEAPAPTPTVAPAEGTGRPSAEIIDFPSRAGNINLRRIRSADEAKNLIVETAQVYKPQLTEATRGVQTNEVTRALADELGMTPESLLARRPGQAFNAEEALAARNLLVTASEDVIAAAKRVQGVGGEEALAAFEQAMLRHRALQEQVSGVTAEAGRALQSFNIMAESKRRGDAIAALIEQAGGADKLERVASSLADADLSHVGGIVRAAGEATTADKFYFAWINSLLSGPKTHLANILGNTGSTINHLIESGIAELLPGDAIKSGETAARAAGMLRGMVEGLGAAARTLATGRGAAVTKATEAVRPEPIASLRGPAGAWLPTRWLAAEDQIFRAIATRGEIGAQAVRLARTEGHTGAALKNRVNELTRTPTPEMLKEAEATGDYLTFTKALGPAGQSLQRLAASTPGGRFIIPFIRTPANLLKYAGERSPLAPFSPAVRATLAGKNGHAAQQMQIARMAAGSAMATVAADLVLQGRITGSGPDDPQERRVWLETHQPNSFKAGDRWVSYQRLEPLSTVFGTVATTVEAWQRNAASDEDMASQAASLIEGLAKNMADKSFLLGPIQALQAVMDPERYGESWLSSLAGTLVPRALTTIAELNDPFVRSASGIEEGLMRRIPGLREQLPLKRGLYGEPLPMEAEFGPAAISPLSSRQVQIDPLTDEFLRLDVFPSRSPKNLKIGDLTAELSSQEISDLEADRGNLLRTLGDNLVNNPRYQGATDQQKRELLDVVAQGSAKLANTRMRFRVLREAVQQ